MVATHGLGQVGLVGVEYEIDSSQGMKIASFVHIW